MGRVRPSIVAIVAVLLSACMSGQKAAPSTSASTVTSGATTSGATPSSTPPVPTTRYSTTYVKSACDIAVPDNARIECGTLTVPSDRDDPTSGNVTIPVAIIHPASATRAKDPIIYFSGGPGFPGRTIANFFLSHDVVGDHDVIVFDQRGTGQSTPSLDCPEVVEPIWAALGSAGDPVEEGHATGSALLACRARLVAHGVDLDAYNTPTTAADVEDLRRALGVDRWNIFGVSYGTRVAQEVARTYPAHVRSVVLDSNLPPDVAPNAENRIAAATRALGVLASGCRASAVCSKHGDVAVNLQRVLDQWTAQPFVATVDDPTTNRSRSLAITGSDVVAGLWNAMYDTSLIGLLPSLLPGLLARGDVAKAAVKELAAAGIEQATEYAEAMEMSVDCADTQRLGGTSPVEAAATTDARWKTLLTIGASVPCRDWKVTSVGAAFNSPVVSTLPALVLGDEYDPVTPPADSQRVAKGFANGTYVMFTGLGHGAVFASTCAQKIFRTFIAAPTTKPDTACAASGTPNWA